MQSQSTFRSAGQKCRLPFLFITAACVSFGLQLLPLNGEPVTPETTESPAASASNSSNATTTSDVTVPIPDKGGQVVNVKEYGAVGDGVTNDTAAFIKALAVCAAGRRNCVWFPKERILFLLRVSRPDATSHPSCRVFI